MVKTWDVIIVGGGIIGLCLSIALRKRGARVLLVERGEPGREASHAAAGMLAASVLEMPAALEPLPVGDYTIQVGKGKSAKVTVKDDSKLLRE